jgi:threonine/homoserine/homoserine lactone efflux protein
MSADVFLAMVAFAFVSSITPGPNNLMLLASGVNFGFWRSVPHMLGIGAGFLSLLLGVGFGLGAVLSAYPQLHLALKIVGGAYLLYLAWRIAMSRSMGDTARRSARPMRFWEAAAFQWVNPKAWIMAVTAMALYADPRAPFTSVLFVAVTFALVNLPSVSTWTGFGTALRGFLADPVRLK